MVEAFCFHIFAMHETLENHAKICEEVPTVQEIVRKIP